MSVRSEYILGRKTNATEFSAGREFTVSVYRHGKKLRYTDPVTNDPWAAKPSVIYRIRVTPKRRQP